MKTKSSQFFISVLCSMCFVLSAQAQELLDYPLDTIKGQEVYLFKVPKGIGIYRVGVTFNVSQQDIIRFNPHVREQGLHCGETLYIPTKRPVNGVVKSSKNNNSLIVESDARVVETRITETVLVASGDEQYTSTTPRSETVVIKGEPVKQEPVIAKQEPIVVKEEPKPVVVKEEPKPVVVKQKPVVVKQEPVEVKQEPIVTVMPKPVEPGEVIELAVMLPFESQQSKRSSNAERMMEFYQGVLFGLKDMQRDSLRFRVRVYDTERSERRVEKLTDSTELNNVQAILGLAYPIQIERMATWCQQHNVPLFLPFSNETDLKETPLVLQFNASAERQADSLCHWMGLQGDAQFVAIEVREAELSEFARTLRQKMRLHKIPYTALGLRDLMSDSAAYALDKGKENIIIMHCDKYQQARIVLPHIEKLRRAGYDIRIVSQYSWQKDPIIVPQVYTSMFKSDTEHEAFDSRWSTFIPGEHVSTKPRYDVLGYDMIHAVVAWLQGKKEHNGLETDIRWSQVGNGGWQNSNIKVIEN